MLLNALEYMSFRNAVIYLFSKYLGHFLGPQSVLDTRATTVYKGGKPANPVEVIFWGGKSDNQQLSKQASSHAVLLGVAIFYKENKMIKWRWSGWGVRGPFLDCGASCDHIWTHRMIMKNEAHTNMGSRSPKWRENQFNSHEDRKKVGAECLEECWEQVLVSCRATVGAAAGGARRESIWCSARWMEHDKSGPEKRTSFCSCMWTLNACRSNRLTNLVL